MAGGHVKETGYLSLNQILLWKVRIQLIMQDGQRKQIHILTQQAFIFILILKVHLKRTLVQL